MRVLQIYLLLSFVVAISASLEESLFSSLGTIITTAIEQGSYLLESEKFLENTTKQCSVAATITCTVDKNGEDCSQLSVPYNKCGFEDMTFRFEYCNNEVSNIKLLQGRTSNVDMKNLPQGTMAYINAESVDIDLDDMAPGKCRVIEESRRVNTCWKMINSSLKIEGWRSDKKVGDYCYAWAFYRYVIKRNSPMTQPSRCAISGRVTCKVPETGQSCEKLIVPFDDCKKQEMQFTFKYCNDETNFPISFREGDTSGSDIDMNNLPPGTMAFIHKEPVDINLNDLLPGRCRKIVETRLVDTCWGTIDASLKVEGWRGNGNHGDFCYSWDFYRAKIKRPSAACNTSAAVSCTVARTGESCEDLVVPLKDCGREAMTFSFEYCNYESNESIQLMRGNLNGDIDMNNLPRGTMAFIHKEPVDISLNDLLPGRCRKIVETRLVDTCRETIDASLKVEGWRGNGNHGDFCYSWDFYRSYINRSPTIPTQSPSAAFEPCKMISEVSCTVDETGQPCERMIVPLSQCRSESFTFSFEYCNKERFNHVDLIKGNTDGNLDMKNLPRGTMAFVFKRPVELNFEDMNPEECRVIKYQRELTTCRPTIEASLKVEGWRGKGETGDYCFAWNFYKINIAREDMPPTKSPTSKCDVDASVSCVIDRTGQDCHDLVVPLDKCGEEQMTFTFEYCSNELDDDIRLNKGNTSGNIDMKNLPKGTMAFIHTESVTLDTFYLPPGECSSVVVTRPVSTCRSVIDASLKVEGWRGAGKTGDFCYAWKFYRRTITRVSESNFPTPNPTKFNIGTSMPTVNDSPQTDIPTISIQPTVEFCGIPKEAQRARISDIIDSVSSRENLRNPNSPQSKARKWILFEDTFDSFCPPPCNRDRIDGGVIQRYTMAVFYFATGGDKTWLSCGENSPEICDPQLTLFQGDPIDIITGNETWLEPVSECLWGGLSCRMDTQCLDRIEFEANGVGGRLPEEIEQLNLLRFLYLEGAKDRQQYFEGNLQLLQGTIPPQVATLSKLIILDLNFNLFEGPIPSGVFLMNNLRHLDIDHNRLEGSIPQDIKSLTNLRFLQLDNNLFTGQIPSEIGLAKSLINALFHDNFFTGIMPDELCQLSLSTNLTMLSADCDEVVCECDCICDGLV